MKFVSVKIDGQITTHLPDAAGNYATLCGLDGHDSAIGQEECATPKGAKVDCVHCTAIFFTCREFKPRDFHNAHFSHR